MKTGRSFAMIPALLAIGLAAAGCVAEAPDAGEAPATSVGEAILASTTTAPDAAVARVAVDDLLPTLRPDGAPAGSASSPAVITGLVDVAALELPEAASAAEAGWTTTL
jgi:hypothetical protein